MSNCCCEDGRKSGTGTCPACGREGQPVKNITVRHMVNAGGLPRVGEGEYYLCRNPRCEIVYFAAGGETFSQAEVRVPVWCKENARPKYACYCSRVTEEEVVNAVVNRGARTVQEVAAVTGAMQNGNCLVNNPSGQCCHREIQRIIAQAVKKR